jgi:hypothetical protein
MLQQCSRLPLRRPLAFDAAWTFGKTRGRQTVADLVQTMLVARCSEGAARLQPIDLLQLVDFGFAGGGFEPPTFGYEPIGSANCVNVFRVCQPIVPAASHFH